ncbi:MAG: ribonuclease HI family protein [Candidatus Magasanikbacteria bacterium]|nr:ribonuclease HI family protein [Candidatus Magasanikbacteria bacterium]
MKLITYTDGGSRGNPGPAALGVVIKNAHGETIEAFGTYIGHTTNNQAEYQALVAAMETATKLGATEVACFLDSELIVKQMKREYRVRDLALQTHYLKIYNMAQKIGHVTFTHVPREKNKEADAEVNKALDAHARAR